MVDKADDIGHLPFKNRGFTFVVVRVQDMVKCFISTKAQDTVNYFRATVCKSKLSHAISQKETAWTMNRNFDYAVRRCVCACRAFRIPSFSKRYTAAPAG